MKDDVGQLVVLRHRDPEELQDGRLDVEVLVGRVAEIEEQRPLREPRRELLDDGPLELVVLAGGKVQLLARREDDRNELALTERPVDVEERSVTLTETLGHRGEARRPERTHD